MKRWNILLCVVGLGMMLPADPLGAGEKKADPPKTQLDGAGLEKMLKGLGYEITYYIKGVPTIQVDRGSKRYPVSLFIGTSRELIYLETTLNNQLKGPNKFSTKALLKLLALNDEIGPAYFSVHAERGLLINRPVANDNLAPAVLRQEIETFVKTIKDTDVHWDPKLLTSYDPPPATKESEADLKRLQGTWILVEAEQKGEKIVSKQEGKLIFRGGKVTIVTGTGGVAQEVYVDPSTSPKSMDLFDAKTKELAQTIYQFQDDQLWICFELTPGRRPAAFTTNPKSTTLLTRYKKTAP